MAFTPAAAAASTPSRKGKNASEAKAAPFRSSSASPAFLTAIFEESPHGYIGYVEELPGANAQGETLEETKKNLIEAIALVLQTNRQLAEEELAARPNVIRETLGRIAA